MNGIRVYLSAHKCKRFIIALKYKGETEYRYLVASDLSWRMEDIVAAYSLRWRIEVFIITLVPSEKHMINRDLGRLEPTPALIYKNKAQDTK